jgi:hypothetical protein
MEAMWAAFFVLLLSDELPAIRDMIRDLPLAGELVAWIALFPWLLGTAVWTGPWAEPTRVVLVLGFAVGWSLLSIPRRERPRASVRRPPGDQ